MVDCNQHGMSYCNISALFTAMNTDTGKLSRKVALLDSDSSMSTEDKRCFQHLVAFGRSTGVPLLSALVISRAQTRPFGNMGSMQNRGG